MKLLEAIIRPGQVLEVLENGKIKASAPGLFGFNDDPNKMPPIEHWAIGSNCNTFTQPKPYDNVWIMNFKDNPRQLYWFRKDRVTDSENLLETFKEENVEVLCNRNIGGDWATIYFSDGSGWIIGKGDSIIQIRPNGTILLDIDMPNRAIDICTEGVCLGAAYNNGEFHPVAYGDKTQDALSSILAALKVIQQVAMVNPYTMAIGTALLPVLQPISGKISDISSNDVITV